MEPLLGLALECVVTSRQGEAETRSEVSLNGVPASSLICWPFVRGGACTCGGKLAHRFDNVCAGALNEALGSRRGCRYGAEACKKAHVTRAQVLDTLGGWWQQERSTEPPTWGTVGRGNTAAQGERSTASSAGTAGFEAPRCTVPASTVLERLCRHSEESGYITAFLNEEWLDELLADDAMRSLLGMRKAAKEITEAYGAASRVLEMLRKLRRQEEAAAAGEEAALGEAPTAGRLEGAAVADRGVERGEGAIVLDVCSGKGLAALIISFMLPAAKV